MSRYKKLLIALAAIASIYIVKLTKLDKGLIDQALNAAVETMTTSETPLPDTGVVGPTPAQNGTNQ